MFVGFANQRFGLCLLSFSYLSSSELEQEYLVQGLEVLNKKGVYDVAELNKQRPIVHLYPVGSEDACSALF